MVSGSVYPGKDGRTYLALYPFFSDVYMTVDGLERVVHARYKGFREGGIEIFSLPANEQVYRTRFQPIYPDKRYSNADRKYDIKYEITKTAKNKRVLEQIIDCVRTDVSLHCGEHQAKNPTGSEVKVVDKFVPLTKARYMRNIENEIDLGGKADFVDECIIQANKDFSIGCISEWVPGKNSSADGEFFKNYALRMNSGCLYCYAGFQHTVNFAKSIKLVNKEKLEQQIKENNVHILRLGKRTETGSIYTRNQLIDTLDVCIKTKTQIIMPTKFLEYDPEVARRLRATQSVALFSEGPDGLEPGAYDHGCDNEFRLEQAKKYRDAGANSCIYLLTDITKAAGKRELKVLDFAAKNKIPVQFLPARIMNKRTAKELTGKEWNELKINSQDPHQNDMFPSGEHGCYKKGGNSLIAQRVDEFWLKLIENNNGNSYRICHHDDNLTYCGRCFLQKKDASYMKGAIIPTVHKDIEYTFLKAKREFRRRMREKAKKKGNLDIHQMPLKGEYTDST